MNRYSAIAPKKYKYWDHLLEMWDDEEHSFRDQIGVNCRSQLKREGLLRRTVNKSISNHLGRL